MNEHRAFAPAFVGRLSAAGVPLAEVGRSSPTGPRFIQGLRRSVSVCVAELAAACFLALNTAGQTPAAPHSTGFQFHWGETNLVARGGWGRLIRLTNDEWLSVNTRFARGESALQIRHCRNFSGTWDLRAEIGEPGRYLDNGELVRLNNGNILLTGRSLIHEQSYRLPVYRSMDGGQSWVAFGNTDTNEGPPGSLKQRGLWEPHFFPLADGRLAVAYASEKHAGEQPSFSQVCSERISPDEGKNWGDEIILAAEPGGGTLRPGMPVVARMTNGKYLAVYEIVGKGDADVYSKVSADGEHWPPGLGIRIEGHHAGPWVLSLADGELLVTSCANRVSFSRDFGATWNWAEPPPWDVGPGKIFTWPAIYETGTNQIAALISWHGVRIRQGSWTRSSKSEI